MTQDSHSKMLPKVQIRMDDRFRQRLMEAAYKADRSLNAEIMARLEKSFDDDAEAVALAKMVEHHEENINDLWKMVEDLQHNMREIIQTGGPSRDMR